MSRVEAEAPEVFPFAGAWVEDCGRVYLMGSRCEGCNKLAFARRRVCEACGEVGRFHPERLPPSGVVYSFSEIHVAPDGFAAPYVLAYVDFPGDVRVCGQVDGPAAGLRIGDEVEVVVGIIRRRQDRPVISYKFRKAGGAHCV